MLSEGKTWLLRSAIFVGLASVVTTIIYLTPIPEANFATCERPCNELDWPMICRIKLTLEVYQTFSRSCGECPRNTSDCFRKFCVVADGFRRGLLTANRQLPGPVIQVCENDILLVDIVNRVPGQGFGIHWRGQPQKETPVMDGVPMVTQCPIPSSTTFQYKFRASRPGTHMWHAHTGVQLTDGIFGALIVRQPAKREPHLKQYDVDDPSHVIVINEWNHGFAIQRLLEPNPGISTASLLINGRSQPKKLDGSAGHDPPLSSFMVAPGKRYRFRLAYAGGGRACPITVSIANHVLSVISLDGNPIIPREVTSFVMAAGERADFVLTADQPVANYWLHVNTSEDCDTSTIEGAAILRYDGAPESSEPFAPKPSDDEQASHSLTLLNTVDGQCMASKNKDTLCLSDVKALNKMQRELAEKKVDISLYLAFGFKQLSGENSANPSDQGANMLTRVLVPQLNNFTFMFPSSPLLTQAEDVIPDLMCQQEKPPPRCVGSPICECVHVIDVPLGATVELILVDQGGSDSGHVFHLHGYSFYVVGVKQLDQPTDLKRIQELDSRDSLLSRNLVNPVLKDTVTVPSNGVSVLRFKADNPGYWLLHDQHVSYWTNGFDVILHVGRPNDVPPTPKDFPRCGNWVGPEYFLT